MDKFNPVKYNGGMPITQDDLEFIQNASRDGFKGVLSALMRNYDKGQISGTKITDAGDHWHVAEGYVFYSSELWYVPAHDVTKVSGTLLYFIPDNSWNSNGNKTYENSDVHDTWQIRRMKLSVLTSPPADGFEVWSPYDYDLTWYLATNLTQFFPLRTQNAWVNANLLNGWAVPVGTGRLRLRYRLEPDDNHVEITGWVKGDNASNIQICTLPSPLWPSSCVEHPVVQNTSPLTYGRLFIDSTNGHLSIAINIPTSAEICINVRYPIL
jgi:hypothetical protein